MQFNTSPKLYVSTAAGTRIQQVTIEVTKSGEDKKKYYEIKLSNVIVSSVRTGLNVGTTTSNIPIEFVSFQYGRIEWIYTLFRSDGSSGGQTAAGWDLEKNKNL